MILLLRSIFFKEFLKTRAGMALLCAGNLAFMTWLWLAIRRLFLQDHPEIVWYRVLDLGQIPYAPLAYLPLCSALVFCCFQFLPEMRDERFRISLHLPCGMAPLILAHLLFGLLFLTLLYGLDALVLVLLCHSAFPPEAARLALLTTAPWFLAGLYAYLCLAFCLLEPQRKARLLGVMLAAGICPLLFARAAPGAFAPSLPFFAAGLPVLAAGLLLPALNYRHRRIE